MATIDSFGRLVIPADIRHQAGLVRGAPVEFEVRGVEIVVRPAGACCVFCGQPGTHRHMGKGVCSTCMEQLCVQVEGRP